MRKCKRKNVLRVERTWRKLYAQSENYFLWDICMYMNSTEHDWCVQKMISQYYLILNFNLLRLELIMATVPPKSLLHVAQIALLPLDPILERDLPPALPIGPLCSYRVAACNLSAAVCQLPGKGPLLTKWSIILSTFSRYKTRSGTFHIQRARVRSYYLHTALYTVSLLISKAHSGNAF